MYMSKNFEVVADLKKFQDQKVTVYRAKKIVTMNTAMPWAECVAVADGTIIAVGDFTDMEAFFKTRAMTYQINDTFTTMLFIRALLRRICTPAKRAV